MIKRNLLNSITKKVSVGVLAASMSLIASADIPEKTLSISTASQGGAWYGIAARVMQDVERAAPGLTTQVQPGGAINNIRRVNAEKTDLAISIDFINGLAAEGSSPFKEKQENVRYLMKLFPGYVQVITREGSNIDSFEDLFDKRIAAGKNGWASELLFKLLLSHHDMDYKKLRAAGGVMNFVGTGQATQMMRDGNLDAIFIAGNPPIHPKFNELATTTDIDMLKFDDATLASYIKEFPFLTAAMLPNKLYRGVEGGFKTLGGDVVVVARESLSDEAAYTIVKAFYENLDAIKGDMRQLRENELKKALIGVTSEIHPGAARYYKEKGLM